MLYLSPAFTAVFQVALACLTLPNPSTLLTTLELLRDVLGHDSLDSAPSSFSSGASTPSLHVPSGPAGYVAMCPAIRTAVQAHGFQLCQLLLTGLLVEFPEDAVSTVVTLFALLSTRFPDAVKVWVPPIAEGLPSKAASPNDRAAFVAKFNRSVPDARHGPDDELMVLRLQRHGRGEAQLCQGRAHVAHPRLEAGPAEERRPARL